MEPGSTDVITSTANAEVKRLRSLHERKFRRQTGWFLAEGMRICTEAAALGWRMHRLAYLASRAEDGQVQALLGALERDGGRRLPVTESLLGRISRKDNPQMVLGASRAGRTRAHCSRCRQVLIASTGCVTRAIWESCVPPMPPARAASF